MAAAVVVVVGTITLNRRILPPHLHLPFLKLRSWYSLGYTGVAIILGYGLFTLGSYGLISILR